MKLLGRQIKWNSCNFDLNNEFSLSWISYRTCRCFLSITILSTKTFECVEQKCGFSTGNYYANSFEGPQIPNYECFIYAAKLSNEADKVITDTSENTSSNDEVKMVSYWYSDVKFIPNSLFTTFANLEQIYIAAFQNFTEIRPHFFKNANHLKIIRIYGNDLTRLSANVFVEARNLENINLSYNKIETVDKSAFSGLASLVGIYLDHNKIKNMHPSTFSQLTSLQILNVIHNECIDQEFNLFNATFTQIEDAIRVSCTFV